jgi:hypothetical protein
MSRGAVIDLFVGARPECHHAADAQPRRVSAEPFSEVGVSSYGPLTRRRACEKMTLIDAVILNLTERSCRTFQRLTGRTNVWLAVQLTNLSIIVYFVWAGMYSPWMAAGSQVLLATFCAVLLYALAQTLFKVPIESVESAAYQRVAKGYRNPRRVRDALLRISFLTLALVLAFPVLFVYANLHLVFFLLCYSLIVLTTVVLYLLACDPLPPCRSLLKHWILQAYGSRSSARAPARMLARL